MIMRVLSTLVAIVLTAGVVRAGEVPATQPDQADGSAAERMGWRLSVQCWTFNRYTFFEAVDKAQQLGLKYIEAYPGQRLSKDRGGDRFIHTMSAEAREAARKKLADAGIKLVNYGVVGLGSNEKSARAVFDFAREMGIETIVSEPGAGLMDTLDKLCEEYGINVAVHNHPKPSGYWNPDRVVEVTRGHHRRIGSCSDTGHWMRSGVDPVAALRKLRGRVISLHFKDLNERNSRGAHDVVWGTGAGDVKAMLSELRRQGFRGVFSIEYETKWTSQMEDLAGCIKAFNRLAAEVEAEVKPQAAPPATTQPADGGSGS